MASCEVANPERVRLGGTAVCSSTTAQQSGVLVAQVCSGTCVIWREVVAGDVGTPPCPAPCLHQPIAVALAAECRVLSSPFG